MKAQKVLSYLLIVVYIFLLIFFIVEHRKIKAHNKKYNFYIDYEGDDCNSLSPCVSLCLKNNENLSNEEVKNAVNHFVLHERRIDYLDEEESSEKNFSLILKDPECHFFESKVIMENESVRISMVSKE